MTELSGAAGSGGCVILPYRVHSELTLQAVMDALQQTVDPHLIVIDNGAGTRLSTRGAERQRIHRWLHQPPIPLAAVWNHALDFAWSMGYQDALVINNDIRMQPALYAVLREIQQRTRALFVSPVNVGDAAWMKRRHDPSFTDVRLPYRYDTTTMRVGVPGAGGPDFSCFLITKACHQQYRFDERFAPAYCEDLDYHRRILLDGQGHRIFSVPIPYYHQGSGTLNALDQEHRERLEAEISAGSRAHYRRKWGGDVNQELYQRPFDETSRAAGVTTPELQRRVEWPHGD